MLKKLIAVGLMLSCLSLPLLAQQTKPSDASTPARIGKGRVMQRYLAANPATRAQKMTDRMTQELGLDQATAKKVYEAALARAQKVDDIQASADDNKTKNQALKANADDFKAKLKGILTPEQFSKVEAMKGRMRSGKGDNTDDSNPKDQR